jgi:transposase-like protein
MGGRVKEDFWGDFKRETVRALERLLERSLEVKAQDLIGSKGWEHNSGRWTYRNESYERGLMTGLGYIERLRVPRVRDGKVRWKTISWYKRRSKDVNDMVIEMFLAGVSTRRVEEVLRPLRGSGAISAGSVSVSFNSNQLHKFCQHRKRRSYCSLDSLFAQGSDVKGGYLIKKRKLV